MWTSLMVAWSQPFGMTVAARTVLKWRSATALRMRPRLMKRGRIRKAVADLHFKTVRAATVIPNGWDHATIKDVHMHLRKPAGAPEPVNQRMSRHGPLPQRS